MPYISEMFTSIQGEGMYMGYPAYFIRFAGCNVHCPFCDTAKAQTATPGTYMPPVGVASHVINEIRRTLSDLVVFTGGEPLLQCHDMNFIIQNIYKAYPNIKIQVETSGSVEPWIESGAQTLFNLDVEISLSPKAATMHPEWLAVASQVKVLVDEDGPLLPDNFVNLHTMLNVFRAHNKRHGRLYFQPVAVGKGGKLDIPKKRICKAIELARLHNGALGVQLHKYLELR